MTELLTAPSDTQGIACETAPASFEQVEEICRRAFGFRLFTVLRNRPESGEIERVYSSNTAKYPPGGRKPMGPTPWGDIVLRKGDCWLGSNARDIRWAFPDAELILSLGCQSCACVPVLEANQTIGVLSLSHEADHYGLRDLTLLSLISGLLLPLLKRRLTEAPSSSAAG